MTMSSAANKDGARTWRSHGATGWLALAASPTFAAMAWIDATNTHPTAFCSADAGMLSIHGMTPMYLLMCLFHLSPWLKLTSGNKPART